MMRRLALPLAAAMLCLAALPAAAVQEPPMLSLRVAKGELPPLKQRLPEHPCTADFSHKTLGEYGGELVTLGTDVKDTRLAFVYGYTRLVTYAEDLSLKPDLLEAVDVAEGRRFTLHLRKGLRWSDGELLTSADFRFWWEKVANNKKLSPGGPPVELVRQGEKPQVSYPDDLTVVYEWSRPNPYFLPELAAAAPLQIFLPEHYLKRFHADYVPEDALKALVEREKERNWTALFNHRNNLYKADNPDLPTVDPWVATVRPPSDRFVFERNPYYCRVDPQGRQLPYIDRLVIPIVSAGLVAAKTGAGESNLQGRNLRFDSYSFLRNEQPRHDYDLRLWTPGAGAQLALYPNLTVRDPVWRAVLRDVRFRRALSMGINRPEIDAVIYFGLATPGNNGPLAASPLFSRDLQSRWTRFDPGEANRLLDEMGLTQRDGYGTRRLPDGRTVDIVIETAGDAEETDVLNLIRDHWEALGIRLHVKPSQLEVFRNRIFGGTAVMSIGKGLENGQPTPEFPPREIAPTEQIQYQWSGWGEYQETGGKAGEPVDMPDAQTLRDGLQAWSMSADKEEQRRIWQSMLQTWVDDQFTIGIVAAVPQPIVVSRRLRNVPTSDGALWNWNPGAQFGIHRPDTFWWVDEAAVP